MLKKTEKESISTETVSEVEQEDAATEESVVEKEPEMEIVYLVSKDKVFSNWGEEAVVEYTQYTYDELGNELTTETRTEDGTLTHSSSKEYDKNGYLVKEISLYEGEETIITYENNENGDVVKAVSDSNIYLYEYDENGILRKESSMNKDNQLETIDEYDENGILRKTVYYKETGEVEMLYEYNEHGDEVLSKYVIAEDLVLEIVSTNEYNANGNLIKVIKNSSDGTENAEEITEYEYDADNNRIKESTNEGAYVTTREYDGNKNLVKVTSEAYGEVSCFEYEYDENGNKIKTISYDANGVVDYQIESEYISMELPKKSNK